MTRTAIIAGQGRLALILAHRMPDAPVFALEGFAPEMKAGSFRLERLIPFLDHLAEIGVTRVLFAGAVQRPKLDPEAFDPATAQLVPRMLTAIRSGDDAALRALLDIFEESGLGVVGVQDVAPDLIPAMGVLCGEPDAQHKTDAARASEILESTGPLDIGQGVVVARGLCLALETLPGTEAMLDFVARHGSGGGVFYKAPKAGQDRRVDLPTIGPDTIDQAVAARLAGIAWQAGGVILLDRDETIRRAEAAGLFLWAR
ncbi:UDP-2,3-diacylglucosamine diphosphatase LpxI [Paracoccus sp. TK19116]|uniref:UDP-2,3-diacylglucosamine diphosphatase LpxI n=1 Tax=Paracoccus albicereus TaxID=2922394 RepID=A0ABT1MQ80_9RHOB|nr:UDP-2,3-diacylglucosamine diphosphatase LpxI [Paracoccus albicereus]MCQ0969859.1 UDP-2,3-diacylglucosamine diphosphatase LpxI [Paracoccus albicereus]